MATRPSTSRKPVLIAVVTLVVAAGAVSAFVLSRPPNPAAQIAHGAEVYAAHCASCHGEKLQGQPDWRHLNTAGRLPAPPLDDTGHAWRHSNAELLHIVRFSVLDQAGPDYKTDMPAFDGKLAEADMQGLVAFIRSRWKPGIQAAQSFLNPNREGMPDRVDGDWRLPADCDEPVRGKPALSQSAPTQ